MHTNSRIGHWRESCLAALAIVCLPVAACFVAPSAASTRHFFVERSRVVADLGHRAPRPSASRVGLRGMRAQRGSRSEFSEEDEENMEMMKEKRQLPFDKGASEFVPTCMQPANEWQDLKETFFYDWPLLETPQFAMKIGICFGFWFLVSLPIASETWSQDSEIAPRIIASVLGGAIPSLFLVLRLLFGVKLVADRLEQDAVYFESDERRPTTAVDLQRMGYRNQGATWIKPNEIAARDKLIKQFEVTPVQARLNKATLFLVALIAISFPLYSSSTTTSYFDPRFAQSEGRLDNLRSTSYDGVANREGQRLRERGNKPAYCYTQYYKAVAGQDNCK